ncbi:MAG: hypothetical protein J6A68_03860 [Oscillospiraceae bacterium]|nr:hypothetical protein [Oscillospiraceae bacterium]
MLLTNYDFWSVIQKAYHIEDEKTVIKIPFENIEKVTKEHLFYKNLDGITMKICLADCAENFSLALGEEIKLQSHRTIRSVGGRCFSCPIAFYEFFTAEHHIRFYMVLKQTLVKKLLRKIGWNPDAKTFERFYSLQKKLNAFGYSAIDLT